LARRSARAEPVAAMIFAPYAVESPATLRKPPG
jgi:hypothetical protein